MEAVMSVRRNNNKAAKVAKKFARLSYGSIIDHSTIESAIGISRKKSCGCPDKKYYHMMSKVKMFLMADHKRFLVTKNKIGYLVCEPKDCHKVLEGMSLQGLNLQRKAVAYTNYLPEVRGSIEIQKTQKSILRIVAAYQASKKALITD